MCFHDGSCCRGWARRKTVDGLMVYLVVAVAWMVGGVIGGATGIGAIMVAMPIMTTVLSPGEAVLVSCLTGLYGTMHLSIA